MGNSEQIVITESETARRLNISVSGLRKWRREGTGPKFMRFGRLIRYSVDDLKVWLSERIADHPTGMQSH
jgi:hypothetical protein